MINEGVIKGGMIPKVKNAIEAAKGGGMSVICDGRVEGDLKGVEVVDGEVFWRGGGTVFR